MPIARRPMLSASNPEIAWRTIRQYLDTQRLRIQHEITGYPAPIPACDACFNNLLQQRALICDELWRMERAAAESAASTEPLGVLERFIASSDTGRGGFFRTLLSR